MTNKNIFVACDVSSQKEIIDLLELIHKDISGIKIGLQYITQRSPEEIKELSTNTYIRCKFHSITYQPRAMKSLCSVDHLLLAE